MILSAFTLFHVAISLAGIGAGLVVLYGLLTQKRFDGWTKLFLWTTVATSATGFLFPVHNFMPGHAVGIISLVVLTLAILARYRYHWRRTYVITGMIALYLNVFVLVVQLFQKVPALKELAPTQSEPPFQIAQLVTLLIFATLTTWAAIKFKGDEPAKAMGAAGGR